MLVNDKFWSPKIELNRVKTIPYVFSQCEQTGRIDNFAIAGGIVKGRHTGERYNDSDVFKIIEGACYSLMETPDPVLREYVDSLVTLIAAAQEDDGYIYTTRTIDPVNMAPGAGRERWIDERVSHELYNAGHMYEAAVAHHLATGTYTFINVALTERRTGL
ncbi:MAG: glycoside hydrolase family 127 protein [Bacteroidales bacterium]|nr:glycoside hydrolase family 127 protein [Bacteroidales bacterium]